MKTTFKKGDRVTLTKDAMRKLQGKPRWADGVGRVIGSVPGRFVGRSRTTSRRPGHVFVHFPGGSGHMNPRLLEKVR